MNSTGTDPKKRDCDYLLDAVHAELSCPALVLAYFKTTLISCACSRSRAQRRAPLHEHSRSVTRKVEGGSRYLLQKLSCRQMFPEAYESVGTVDGRRYAYDVFPCLGSPRSARGCAGICRRSR